MINVFWGCGQAGIRCLKFFLSAGFKPNYFTCNDQDKVGKKILNVPVIDKRKLLSRRDVRYYITSYFYLEISKELLEAGVKRDQINYLEIPHFSSVPDIYNSLINKFSYEGLISKKNEKTISIESLLGNVLGGEKTWAENLEFELSFCKIPYKFLIPSDQFVTASLNVIPLERSNKKNLFDSACEYFLSSHSKIFIARGGSEMLAAACFVKNKYHIPLFICAFSHNDFLTHYLDLLYLKDSINILFAISEKIKNKFISFGFPDDKIIVYPWKPSSIRKFIPRFDTTLEPIKLVYLGRIIISQKRCDLLLKLACILKTQNVNFQLYFGGNGYDFEYLAKETIRLKLEDRVFFCGLIPRKNIFTFLDNKDVFVSCSEIEGHSLSQFEALSRGLAAVVTDCSGVSDDIIDKFNGFVCHQGNLSEMSSCIARLDHDRILLHKMKLNSIFLFKNKYMNYSNPLINIVNSMK